MLAAKCTQAQTASVTGLFQDSVGQIYANGTCLAQFVPTFGVPGPFTQNGAAFNQQPTCTVDNGGNIAATVTRNDFIQPGKSTWSFTVCPNITGDNCVQINTNIITPTRDLSTTLSVQISVNATPIAKAYRDTEINVIPSTGSSYFNVIDNAMHVWTGSIWTVFATSLSLPNAGTCTNQFVTALNNGAPPTCTTDILASAQHANQGTTSTVLHGNAAGNPSFGSIVNADLNLTPISCTNQFLSAINATFGGTCTSFNLSSAQFANQGTTSTVLHGNAAGNPSFGSVVSNDLNITTSTCTNQFLTAIAANGTGTCTTDTLASAQHANQGTTTTVLHGNAAGNPSFGAVVQGDVTNGYVDLSTTQTVAGAKSFSGAVTTASINNALVVGSGAGQSASMAACYSSASAGQTCLISPNWSETFGSQLVMSKNGVGFHFLGGASVNMSTFGILVNDSITGAFITGECPFGCAPTDTGSGTPTTLSYSGSGAAITAGTVGGSGGVASLGLTNINIDISSGTSATAFNGFCINHMGLHDVSIIGTNAANTQMGFKLNDCATNGTGANNINGLQIIRTKFGIQVNGNGRENDFAMLRLAGQTTPIAGSIGLDFQGNAKNNFVHGGFVSGYVSPINFGGTSNFNDIHIEEDLDSGGGGVDVTFGSGTTNNEVVRTSDIGAFTYTDNGQGNCVRNLSGNCIVKRVDVTNQSANIASTVLYAIPANTTIIALGGHYRVSCYAVVVQQATTSSTLPNIQISWTDNDTNTVIPAFVNCTPNSSGTTNPAVGFNSLSASGASAGICDCLVLNARPGTNINYQTVSYASVGATAMLYTLHLKLEYIH